MIMSDDVRESMQSVTDELARSARDCIEAGLRGDLAILARWRENVMINITKMCESPYAPNPIMILHVIEQWQDQLDPMCQRYIGDDKEG